MGLFDSLLGIASSVVSNSSDHNVRDYVGHGLIDYGKNKADGGHDHRYNTGEDRTPAQKAGDAKKSKS